MQSILGLSKVIILSRGQYRSKTNGTSFVALGDNKDSRVVPPLPPIVLKRLFWRCAVSCYIIGCSCPSTLGLYIWNEVPIVKSLMLMSITSNFNPGAMSVDRLWLPEDNDVSRRVDSSAQKYLYKSHSSKHSLVLSPQKSSARRLSTPWKFSTTNGTAVVVYDDHVGPLHQCPVAAMQEGLLEFEKVLLSTLFVGEGKIVHSAIRRRKNKKRKLEIAEELDMSLKEYELEETHEQRGDKEGVIATKRKREEHQSEASVTDIDNLKPSKRIKEEYVEDNDCFSGDIDVPMLASGAPDAADSDVLSPQLAFNTPSTDDESRATNMPDESLAGADSSVGLRRSARIRTAQLNVQMGNRRKPYFFPDISSEDDWPKKRRRKRKRKKGKKGSTGKVKKEETIKKKRGRKKKEKTLSDTRLTDRKSRLDRKDTYNTELSSSNLTGTPFTSQFGSLLLSQPPFSTPDDLPDKCEIMVLPTDDMLQSAPIVVGEYINFLDTKYYFGTILRGWKSPDFIASAVLSGLETKKDDCLACSDQSINNSSSPEAFRGHVERSSSWLLGTIAADHKVLFRIPPAGCVHLFLIVAMRLVQRVTQSGIWDDGLEYSQNTLWEMLRNDGGFISEMKLLVMLSSRILHVLCYFSGDTMQSLSNSETESMKLSGTTIFTVLCFEIRAKEENRRRAGRLATLSLSRSYDHLKNYRTKYLRDGTLGSVNGNSSLSVEDHLLQHSADLIESSNNTFSHALMLEGVLWIESLSALFWVYQELSQFLNLSISHVISDTWLALCEQEDEPEILIQCLKFLSKDLRGLLCFERVENLEVTFENPLKATKAVITLCASKPLLALSVFRSLPLNTIPVLLNSLLRSMQLQIFLDELFVPMCHENGSIKDYRNNEDYVTILVPISLSSEISNVKGMIPWPKRNDNLEEAKCAIHISVVKCFLVSVGTFMKCFRKIVGDEACPVPWDNLFSATVYTLNTISHPLLLGIFEDNLRIFGNSLSGCSFSESICELMSLELTITLLFLSECFDNSFTSHLIRNLLLKLKDFTAKETARHVKSTKEYAKNRRTKKNNDLIATDFNLLSPVLLKLCPDTSHIHQMILTVCDFVKSCTRSEREQIAGILNQLKHVVGTYDETKDSTSSLLVTAEHLDWTDQMLKREKNSDSCTLISEVDIQNSENWDISMWEFFDEEVIHLSSISFRSACSIWNSLRKKRSDDIEAVKKIILRILESDIKICLGYRTQLVDLLFLGSGEIPILDAISIFEILMEKCDPQRLNQNSFDVCTYLYYKIVNAVESDGPLNAPKLYNSWYPKAFLKIFCRSRKVRHTECPLDCCCMRESESINVYKELMMTLARVSSSSKIALTNLFD